MYNWYCRNDDINRLEVITDVLEKKDICESEEFERYLNRLESEECFTYPRTLTASYSLEAAADVKAIYSFDIEKEFLSFLSKEIQNEIDRELIQKMSGNKNAKN